MSDQYVVFGGVAVPVGQAGLQATSQTQVTLSNGLNSNVATLGATSIRIAGPSAAFSIGGLSPAIASSWTGGQTIDVINTTAQVMTITNEDASSAASNRITIGSGVSSTVSPYSRARFVYDGNANRWQLSQSASLYRLTYDVREFGAVGDGVNDDTGAINNAIAAAAVAGGGIVSLPAGTFKLTSTINMATQVHLVGSGFNTIINQSNAVTAITADGIHNYAIKKLQITSGGNGIDFKTTSIDNLYAVLEDVTIKNIGSSSIGIAFYANTGAFYNYFHRFRNVEVVIFVTNYNNAKAVSVVGTAGGVIGLTWQGGRLVGPGTGLDFGASYQCCFNGLAFDGLFNDGPKITISAVNVGSGLFTTSTNHGFSPGQIVRLQTVNGVTGLGLNYFQVASTPALNTFTLLNVALGGSYTGSGGTVCTGAGTAIHWGNLASGNMLSDCRIEEPDIAIAVSCDSGSFANRVDFGPDCSFFPAQIVDPNGTNINILGQGSDGYINTDPRPIVQSNVSLQYGMATLKGLTKTAKSLALVNGDNDDIVNGTWNSGSPVSSSLYVTGPTGAFVITGFKVGGAVSGMEIEVFNTTGQPMTIDHLDFIGSSSAGNKTATLTGSPVVIAATGGYAKFIYNSTLDSGNGAWLAVVTSPNLTYGSAPAGGAITNGTVVLAASTYARQYLSFHGTLSGNATIVLPALDGAFWFIDTTQMVLSGHTLTLQANSNNWGTSLGTAVYYVTYSTLAGKLYGCSLTA